MHRTIVADALAMRVHAGHQRGDQASASAGASSPCGHAAGRSRQAGGTTADRDDDTCAHGRWTIVAAYAPPHWAGKLSGAFLPPVRPMAVADDDPSGDPLLPSRPDGRRARCATDPLGAAMAARGRALHRHQGGAPKAMRCLHGDRRRAGATAATPRACKSSTRVIRLLPTLHGKALFTVEDLSRGAAVRAAPGAARRWSTATARSAASARRAS